MLAGGVVGRVQNVAGVDEATPRTSTDMPVADNAGGYSSSSSSTGGGSGDDAGAVIDPRVVASTTIGTTSRRRASPVERQGSGSPVADPVAAAPPPRPRPIRNFRAERVQGRSWSLEGGEVVARRGVGGEEITGKAAGGASDWDGRRGRGGRRGSGDRR